MWTRKVRYRSPENIVAELKLMREFGINQVNFDDDTFGVSKKNIKVINNSIFLIQVTSCFQYINSVLYGFLTRIA